MTALVPVFGVLAGLLGVLDTIPYVRDMFRGTTRPHRGTWLIWERSRGTMGTWLTRRRVLR